MELSGHEGLPGFAIIHLNCAKGKQGCCCAVDSSELYSSASLSVGLVLSKCGTPQLVNFEARALSPLFFTSRDVFHVSEVHPILR